MEWDVFICHASEDKKAIALPLKEGLEKQGVKTWYDIDSSQLGDSFNKIINNAINNSKFGVIIFSKSFFYKDYPQKELSAFIEKESKGKKVILPVLHNITEEELRLKYPILADRRAISTTKAIEEIVEEIVQVLNNDLSYTEIHIKKFWSDNKIICRIQENKKIYIIFEKILESLDKVFSEKYTWEKKAPFYADSYEIILKANISFFDEKKFPAKLFSIPTNEVDCLLLAVAIEMNSRLMGTNANASDFIHEVEVEYKANNNIYIPEKNFWNLLFFMINTDEEIFSESYNSKIIINLNDKGRLKITNKIYDLKDMSNILKTLNICTLFMPTCEEFEESDYMNKTVYLIQRSQALTISNDISITIEIESIEDSEFNKIYKNINQLICKQAKLNYNTINGEGFEIRAKSFEKTYEKKYRHIDQTLSNKIEFLVKDMSEKYLKLKSPFEIDSKEYITLSIYDEINDFVSSEKLGFIAIGSSGSGKTRTIQHYIEMMNDTHILTIPISPKKYNIKIQNERNDDFRYYNIINLFFKDFFAKKDKINEFDNFLINLNSSLSTKSEKLILILDGINEIDGEVNKIVNLYIELVEFVQVLSKLKLSNIKMILTCRDYSFFQYRKLSSTYPDPKYFYCQQLQETENLAEYYEIKPLTTQQQIEFIDLFFKDESNRNKFKTALKNNAYLQAQFSTPYMIAVAGSVGGDSVSEFGEILMGDIFGKFASAMLQRLNDDSKIFIARKIIKTYIEIILSKNILKRQVTMFTLIEGLGGSKEDKEQAFQIMKELQEINILTYKDSLGECDCIRFTHDRIEEYFIGQYLFEYLQDKDIFLKILNFASRDQVFQGGLLNYFLLCIKHANSYFIEYINISTNYLLTPLPQILFEAFKYASKNNLKMFFNLKRESSRNVFQLFLNGIETSILHKSSYIPFLLFKSIESIIPGYEDSILMKVKYLESLYYMEVSSDYLKAEHMCNLAINIMKENEDILTEEPEICNKIKKLKALIIQNSGELDSSLPEILDIYNYFKLQKKWDLLAETAIDLGMVYRKKTMYDKALEIFDGVLDNNCNLSNSILFRLYMQKGILYKNMMQRELKKPSLNEKNLKKYYNNAIRLFDDALEKIEDNMNIADKIELHTECAETSLKISQFMKDELKNVLGYLDMAEKLLSYYPLPNRNIQYLRIKSKYMDYTGNVKLALDVAIEALNCAQIYKLDYRIFECNYLIGNIILSNVKELSTENIRLGINSLENAIEYCEKYNINDHLDICQKRLTELMKFQ